MHGTDESKMDMWNQQICYFLALLAYAPTVQTRARTHTKHTHHPYKQRKLNIMLLNLSRESFNRGSINALLNIPIHFFWRKHNISPYFHYDINDLLNMLCIYSWEIYNDLTHKTYTHAL